MRTAQECLLKAYNCERQAGDCSDPVVRLMMLEAAKHWRNLAKTAKPPPEHSNYDADNTQPPASVRGRSNA